MTAGFTRRVLLVLLSAGLLGTCAQARSATPSFAQYARDPRIGNVPEVPGDSLRRLEIGFNVGYLSSAARFDTALSRVAHDGFDVIRAYEPFTPHDSSDFGNIVASLRHIVDRGLVPYLSLSNFPFVLEPQEPARQLRADVVSPKRRSTVLRFSNRYPPSNIALYRSMIRSLAGRLEAAFGSQELSRWYFEIGNEPDSPLFFWGKASEFEAVYRSAAEALTAVDSSARIGAAGFTSGLLADPERTPGFTTLARKISGELDDSFVSIHIYDNNFQGHAPSAATIRQFVPDTRHLVVSEWNVSSSANRHVSEILDSEAFAPRLIGIVAVCHEAGVEMLLVHKLMDDPGARRPQLGVFHADGSPKRAYRYLVFMRRLTKRGFRVERSRGLVLLRGGGRIAALAISGTHQVRVPAGWIVTDAAPGVDRQSMTLHEAGWVLLRRGSAGQN